MEKDLANLWFLYYMPEEVADFSYHSDFLEPITTAVHTFTAIDGGQALGSSPMPRSRGMQDKDALKDENQDVGQKKPTQSKHHLLFTLAGYSPSLQRPLKQTWMDELS